jgi:hypothetical protein
LRMPDAFLPENDYTSKVRLCQGQKRQYELA